MRISSRNKKAAAPARSSAVSVKTAGISDEAVQAKTGKTWGQWLKVLDADGARKMTHKEIAKLVNERHGVGPWWCQMVTVGYEQARGLREKHETTAGYQISRSKTVAVPVGRVYKAWQDQRQRGRWLKKPGLTVRTATTNKSMRITWPDGKTSVEVMFYPKGDRKTQVTVQHSKLPDAKAGERMKLYWAEQLGRLHTLLQESPSVKPASGS